MKRFVSIKKLPPCANDNVAYVCPSCGGDVSGAERIFNIDDMYVCPECFYDYIEDMTVFEIAEAMQIDYMEASEKQ